MKLPTKQAIELLKRHRDPQALDPSSSREVVQQLLMQGFLSVRVDVRFASIWTTTGAGNAVLTMLGEGWADGWTLADASGIR